MSDENKLSRRNFIKGAAAVSATVATAGLLTNSASAQAASGLPTKWDKETDVLVVGSGCGLAAAIEAKRAGAQVLVIDKGDHPGGLQAVGGDNMTFGGGTAIQLRDGETRDTLDKWYQDELYSCEYRGVPELLYAYCKRGPDTVKWFLDLGLEFDPLGAGPLRPPIKRDHTVAASSKYPGRETKPDGTKKEGGIAVHTVMHRELDKLGVPILLKHRMTRIYRDGNGPVVGIQAQTPTGAINIRAKKAVILATGGWVDNSRMVQAWDPRLVGPDCNGDGILPADGTVFSASTGDGHLAAQEIGAGLSDMSFVSYVYIFYGSRSYFGWYPLEWETNNAQPGKGLDTNAAFFQRVILVKNDASRFINEVEGSRTPPQARGSYSENPEMPYTATYLSLPHPRNVWAIADADSAAALKWPIEDLKKPDPRVGAMFDPACVAIADSLQELATKIGMDPAKLQATITKYNGFVEGGKDADFGKPMPMFKIAKPPFYAAKANVTRHTQRNGIRINTKSQVIDQADQKDGLKAVGIDQEKVIPHLYAAGEAANSVGFRRVHRSMAFYIVASRIAGENAAKETPLPSA